MKHEKKPKPIEVGVITKLIRILEALHSSRLGPSGSTLKQISRGAGVNKSTTYRFLTHLAREGYLVRTGAATYLIGPKLLRLAMGPAPAAESEQVPPGGTRS